MLKKRKVTCINDYRQVALTSMARKSFERLFMTHINYLSNNMNPLQFANRNNRGCDLAGLHFALDYLDNKNTCRLQLDVQYHLSVPNRLPSLGNCISTHSSVTGSSTTSSTEHNQYELAVTLPAR